MACQIEITSVIAFGASGQPVTLVEVKGTAEECAAVVVKIGCGGTEKTNSVAVDAEGMWEASFSDLSGTGCICDDPNVALRVSAQCKADPTCLDTETLIPIPCQPYGCPEVDHIETQIPNCEQVLQDGGWNVHFKAVINGSGVTNYIWSFGDGDSMVGPNLQEVDHKYVCAGTYEITLVIQSDCEPGYVQVYTTSVEIPPCGCPTVNSITAIPDDDDPCTYTFHAKIAEPFQDCIEQYLWNFGDGSDPVFDTETTTHTYEDNGNYTVTLTLLGGIGEPDGSPCSTSKEVTVSNCKGTGDNGDHDEECPWWNPKCWNWCAILLILALAAIAAAAVLLVVAGCTGDPLTWAAAVATALLGLILLTTWFLVCAKVQTDFCEILNKLIDIFAMIVAIQSIILAILGILELLGLGLPLGCLIGVLVTWGYYGTILGYLVLIKNWTDC